MTTIDSVPDAPVSADPPTVPLEFCQISDTAHPIMATRTQKYHRMARTYVMLKTGGKADVNTRNLHVITAGTLEIRKAPQFRPGMMPPPQLDTIPPQAIKIGGLGTLGPDGLLYKILPDNQTAYITPQIKRNQYDFEVNSSKVRTLPRFKNPGMSAWKTIDPLFPKFTPRQGVLKNDTCNFGLFFSPEVGLADSTITWNGVASGTGRTILANCTAAGSLTESVSVLGQQLRQAAITSMEIPLPNQTDWSAAHLAEAGFAWLLGQESLTWAQGICQDHGAHNCRADAAGAATSRERTNIEAGNCHNETVMDMENNNAGRGLAASITIPPYSDDGTIQNLLKNAARDLADEGKLTVLDDLDNDHKEHGLLCLSWYQRY